MERRLLHRWYGNVPGDDWPTGVRDSSLLSWRGQNDPISENDRQDLEWWGKQLKECLSQEEAEKKKLKILDVQQRGISSFRRDRTEDDEEELRDIEVEYGIAEEKIRQIQADQKHCYRMLKLLGGN